MITLWMTSIPSNGPKAIFQGISSLQQLALLRIATFIETTIETIN